MATCGHRLLPHFVDQLARDDPDLIFVETPKSATIENGLHRVTYRDLAIAIDRCAWWIHKELGPGHGFPTLAYVGPHDLRYLFLVLGACKAGYKMFFASPRNSSAAMVDLLVQADCNIFLMPTDVPMPSTLLMTVLAEKQMQTLDFPEVAFFLDAGAVHKYPWKKTFEEAKNDSLAVFHTSGSTGIPKLITMSHGAVATLDAFSKIEHLTGRSIQTSLYSGKRTLLLFPMFHASALSTLFLSIWSSISTVLPPPVPLTVELANDMLLHCNIEASIMPPSILADMAGNQEYLKNLLKCSCVMYGGGPLPKAAGDLIPSGTLLITVFGSSETGFFPVEVVQHEYWPYIKLSPCAGGFYRPYSQDLFELVIERKSDFAEYQPVFWMYPELQEYHTKDLFSRHPNKPDLWLWQGREDDIIVLSNGEKFNPVSVEGMISNSHPAIEAALVCGQGRQQCALLVELSSTESSEDDKADEDLVEELWPTVQKANEDSPEYGRLMKDMVVIAKQGKKMVRADKGTVQRRRTLEHFAAELDQLYHLREGPASAMESVDRPMDLPSVKEIVTRIVQDISRYQTILSSTSFFDLGLDSLHAMTIARKLRTAFLHMQQPMTTKTVYDCPSIDLLSCYICGLTAGYEDFVKTMQMLYDFHSQNEQPGIPQTATVLLVGSTGHLGTQLLVQLLDHKNIDTILCLNRDLNAQATQSDLTVQEGMMYPRSVRYFQADYTRPRFGLSEEDWSLLQKNVTHVIHNAWPVDFCMPLSKFEPCIQATTELMKLCEASDRKPTYVFISTIGTVSNNTSHVPEKVVGDWLAAEPMGYTQSKLVAERLIATKTDSSGVKSVICRLGQLGGVLEHESWGGQVPCWPEKEWLPAMLASSSRLGAVPSSLGSLEKIDWLPVDVAATAVCEIMLAPAVGHVSCQVYNIVNPQSTTWSDLLPELRSYCDLERLNLHEWITRLKTSLDERREESGPAAGLVDFFEKISQTEIRHLSVDCSQSVKLSPALEGSRRVDAKLLEQWISQWSLSK